MGIFFSYDDNGRFIFNELEAVQPGKQEDNDTSTTDYTQDNDDDQNNQQQDNNDAGQNDNPQDSPEDYTISNDNEGEDQTPEEGDQNPPEEGTEANGGEDQGANDNGGTDYTQDSGGDTGGGGDPSGGDEGGDPSGSGNTGDDMGGDDYSGMNDGGEEKSDDDIKALEDEIFSNYSDQQRQIMSKELKGSMNKLVNLSSDLVDRINDIPKISSHIRIIEFVSNKLSDFRDMLTDYLYYTYDTESYVKNQIAYERFLIIMRQIDELISKIPTVDRVKNKNQDSKD